MKLNYLSQTFFPFLVPEKDSSFASSVGPNTVYPAGFSLGQALQIYWRAMDYQAIAAGNGVASGVTQALTVNQLLPPRNMSVGTASYYSIAGFSPVGPGDLVPGVGLQATVPGSGTISADGSTNPAAVFNLLFSLFFPEIYVPDPVVKYAGLWWPAMSISCSVRNTVTLESGGTLAIFYQCSTCNPAYTTEIGTMSFFGVSTPVFSPALALAEGSIPAETRTFSGSLTVADEWP